MAEENANPMGNKFNFSKRHLVPGRRNSRMSRHHAKWIPAFVAAIAMPVALASAATFSYQLTQLQPLSGDYTSLAHAMNASGTIAGESDGSSSTAITYNASGNPVPATLSAQSLTSSVNTPYAGIGYGINSSGWVAGSAQATVSDPVQAAYFKVGDSANPYYLNNLAGVTGGTAFGISNAANPIIVGQVSFSDNGGRAFTYNTSTNTMTAIDPEATSDGRGSAATAVNSSGTVVGWDQELSASSDVVAFQYSGGTRTRISITGEAPSGSADSHANAINDAGEIVGDAVMSDLTQQAFFYSGSGDATSLGLLPNGQYSSVALGINDAGQIVGNGDDSTDVHGYTHAFIYQDGAMQDLNDLIDPALRWSISDPNHAGWTLTSAEAITNTGQIVGTGFIDDGAPGEDTPQPFSFLLSPVPEPGSGVLVLVGFGMAMLHRWRRTPNR